MEKSIIKDKIIELHNLGVNFRYVTQTHSAIQMTSFGHNSIKDIFVYINKADRDEFINKVLNDAFRIVDDITKREELSNREIFNELDYIFNPTTNQ